MDSSSRVSAAAAAATGGGGPQFPAGLRVLVVDDDPICLKILEAMLRRCLYEVTTCSRAVVALSMLRERKGAFDVVLSDVYMPDMDGFKLLEHIGLEMDLPVIMMSADDGKDVVMKGVTHGACDYLIKPVRIEALKTIWQHVVRKKRNELKEIENSGSLDESDKQKRAPDDDDNASSANEGSWKNAKKRKEGKEDEDENEDREDSSTLKKPRVVWSVELHQQFVTAVNQLGVEKAVPKKILELMNVPGLTRENVASHLQKYRLYLRRVSVPQHQGRFDMPFLSATDGAFGSSSLDGFDLQALAVTGQLPTQNLASMHSGPKRIANSATGMPVVDQISFFNSDTHIANSSRIRSSPGQLLNDKQMNLLCGTPTGIDSTRVGQSQQPVQSYGNAGPQVIEGKPDFMNLSTSHRTSSSFPGGPISGHLNNSIIMQMSQQGQQFSVSQQQNHVPIGMPHQSQLRGQLMNGLQGEQNSMFSPTMGQQLLSNEIAGHVSGKGGTPVNGNTSIVGTYAGTSLYGSVPQPLFVEFPNSSFTESTGGCFPLATSMGASSNISTGMFQESLRATGSTDASGNITNLKGVKNYIPNYALFGELRQTKSADWRLQDVNLPYESAHLGSKQNNININFGSSNSVHQDLSATLRDSSRQNCTVAKDIASVRTEVEHKVGSTAQQKHTYLFENSVRVKAETMPDQHHQDILFEDNIISNELMSVIGTQHQGVIGQGEAELNFDGYSLDDILV